MELHEVYMTRALALAKLGKAHVAPNPMVGAVLVFNNKIIGEGYHQNYGEPHAEVNCISNVSESDKQYIPDSTLYVTLEPCAHYGKTPPCTDLIIKYKIRKVIIGCRDPFIEVNGKGIEILKENGVTVIENILNNECRKINKRFFTFHEKKRPYIILKWARSADNKISVGNKAVEITNKFTNIITHKWRSEETGILIGTNTALIDNPSLTNRYWKGKSPIRIIIDTNLKIPPVSNIFNDGHPVIILNSIKDMDQGQITFKKIDNNSIEEILQTCYSLNIQSIIVEGGGKVLNSFIQANLWDEARILNNTKMIIGEGIEAPAFTKSKLINTFIILSDRFDFYERET